jgi:hypothetical protein
LLNGEYFVAIEVRTNTRPVILTSSFYTIGRRVEGGLLEILSEVPAEINLALDYPSDPPEN